MSAQFANIFSIKQNFNRESFFAEIGNQHAPNANRTSLQAERS
jgi:hypothetical protein